MYGQRVRSTLSAEVDSSSSQSASVWSEGAFDLVSRSGLFIKQATGPITTKSVPLKTKSGENITDKKKQMERWVEHYFQLYSTENVVADAVLDAICQLPVMQELDEKPTEEELRKAIDCLSTGKAPGEDGIPGEVIKAGKEELIEDLNELLCLCWKEGSVPQDMRDAKIVTLYKNKGDRSDCNSYRGISLLSIVGKVFARVILARLKVLAARVYPESQCGFRAGRSTIDMIFSVRQLQEKCQEQNEPLFLAFIDLTKAFDLVSRSGLFQLLKKIGCPQSCTPSSSHSTPTCAVQSATMAQDQSHSQSAVESSRAVCSPPHSLGSSSRCS